VRAKDVDNRTINCRATCILYHVLPSRSDENVHRLLLESNEGP
jgi:hypothetical protein